QRRLIIGGAAASVGAFTLSRILLAIFGHPDQSVVEWDRLVSSFGHSQMPLWVISASGSAALIIGLLLRLVPSAGRAIRPLIAVGQIPLTAYAAHLIIIALLVHPSPETPAMGLLVSTVMMVAIVVFSTVW